MRSFVWSGRPNITLTNRPGRHDVPAAAGWLTRQSGHWRPRWWPGGPLVPGAELSAPSPSGTRSPSRFVNLSSSCLGKAAQNQRLQSWFGNRLANDTSHARCLRGRYCCGCRHALHHSNHPTPLFWQHNEVPPWGTNTAISAFQGKALIAKQSALQVHYDTGREIWRQCCNASLETTSETHLWELVKLIHKNT